MKTSGNAIFDGAEQLFRKWEEPLHTATDRKLYAYYTLILILVRSGFPRLIMTAPRLPFKLPAEKTSIERITCIAFNFSFLDFIRSPYFTRINRLFAQNATGLEFPRESVSEISEQMRLLSNSFSPENLTMVIHILNILSRSESEQLLADAPLNADTKETEKQKRAEMIIRYIHDHYRRSLSLGELAGYLGLSRERTSMVCRECLPGGFAGYLLKVRMDDVARQLIHTNYSTLSIAEDCGFSTFSNFMVLFKKRYGMTPGKYRKMMC